MEKTESKALIKKYISNATFNYSTYLKNKYKNYKYICMFGVGNIGLYSQQQLKKLGIIVDFFCDNDSKKWGGVLNEITCISLQELISKKEDTMVLIATRYYKEIYLQLENLNFKNIDRVLDNKFLVDAFFESQDREFVIDKLSKTVDILEDDESCRILTRIIQEWTRNEYLYAQIDDIYSEPQYFMKELVGDEIENFVDCGAYTGDTLEEYIKYVSEKFNKVYLFELSKLNCERLLQNIRAEYAKYEDKLLAINKGVAGDNRMIKYTERDEGSNLADGGETEGEIVTLDSILLDKEIDFIKMDIEGAELEALEGAHQIIKEKVPKLAICIYHKPQDLWEIPLKIKELQPDYKIYIRHHTDLLNETVCYAIK